MAGNYKPHRWTSYPHYGQGQRNPLHRPTKSLFLLDRAGTGLLSGSPGKEAFFIDSWKFLTRNPHKLFPALEYVPASGGKIVTHNASLENGTASCRQGFLRPAHVDGEILAKFSRQDQGTSMIHQQALERIADR